MKLIGYRFKNNKEECWAYTYDLDGVRRGNGLRDYKYVDSIYADENFLDVETNVDDGMTGEYKKWKVNFFGEGTSWSAENLTYEQASSRIDNCPTEYFAFMEPME